MTRFLMSLEDSVDLVLYAFQHDQQGDIFVQKAPASTVADLAVALRELFGSDTAIKTIGTRHGEKFLRISHFTRGDGACPGYGRLLPYPRR